MPLVKTCSGTPISCVFFLSSAKDREWQTVGVPWATWCPEMEVCLADDVFDTEGGRVFGGDLGAQMQ